MITKQLHSEKDRQGHFEWSLAGLFRYERYLIKKICLVRKAEKRRSS